MPLPHSNRKSAIRTPHNPIRISGLRFSNRKFSTILCPASRIPSSFELQDSSLQSPWPRSDGRLIENARLRFDLSPSRISQLKISNRERMAISHPAPSPARLSLLATRHLPLATAFLTQHIDLPSTYGLAWRAQEVRLEPRSVPGVRRVLFSVAVISGVFLLSLLASRPPAAKSAKAPESEFSAARARVILDRLVGDGIPHPTGSAANDAVRARILDEFSKLGYAPEVQTGFACDEYGTCATVNNVVARLDGSEPGQSVLLAAHYDSVPAGPAHPTMASAPPQCWNARGR